VNFDPHFKRLRNAITAYMLEINSERDSRNFEPTISAPDISPRFASPRFA
jgi:hypothetical protein